MFGTREGKFSVRFIERRRPWIGAKVSNIAEAYGRRQGVVFCADSYFGGFGRCHADGAAAAKVAQCYVRNDA